MSCLAIIPARAGSEGVKNKNVALLGGVPLLVHAIRAARQRGVVDVVVTTDSPAYADLAAKNGAEVVMRLPHQADAAAPLDPVLIHALNAWERRAGGRRMPEYVATLQPDVPFRRAALLPEALEQIERESSDSLLCVTPLHFVWQVQRDATLRQLACNPDVRGAYVKRPNRQDLKDEQLLFHETGLLYLTRTPYLLATGARLGGVVTAKMVSPLEAMEIDTEEDMARAQALWGIWKP